MPSSSQVVSDGEELPVVAQQGWHGGAQHEGQLDQLMRQEVAVVVVQAGQLRHLHQPSSFQTSQEEKKKKKKMKKEEEEERRNRRRNREQEGQKVRQGAVETEDAAFAVLGRKG